MDIFLNAKCEVRNADFGMRNQALRLWMQRELPSGPEIMILFDDFHGIRRRL